VRVYGQYAYAGLTVYPEFQPTTLHAHDPFIIPRDWTIYVAIDPGTRLSAALFAAVPPTGAPLHFYDELRLEGKNADQLAELVKHRLAGRKPQAFLFDKKAGDQTPMGFQQTVRDVYREAFARISLESVETGSNFYHTIDVVEAREEVTKQYLRLDLSADPPRPGLVVHRDRCPHFCRQLKKQRYKTPIMSHRPGARDKTVESDVATCGEYLCAYRPRYVPPVLSNETAVGRKVWEAFQEKQRQIRSRGRKDGVIYL